MVTSEGGTYNLKIDVEWTNDEDDEALGNSNTLNDNFNCMEKNMLRLINTCSEAKEAWEILKIAYEGTSKVRMSRL